MHINNWTFAIDHNLFICFFKINYPSKKYQNEERSLKNLAIIIMIIIIMTDSDNYYIKKFNKF